MTLLDISLYILVPLVCTVAGIIQTYHSCSLISDVSKEAGWSDSRRKKEMWKIIIWLPVFLSIFLFDLYINGSLITLPFVIIGNILANFIVIIIAGKKAYLNRKSNQVRPQYGEEILNKWEDNLEVHPAQSKYEYLDKNKTRCCLFLEKWAGESWDITIIREKDGNTSNPWYKNKEYTEWEDIEGKLGRTYLHRSDLKDLKQDALKYIRREMGKK